MSELWLIRHAQTAWSETGRHTGRTDVPLAPAGETAAAALAPRLAGHRFSTVFCSPLVRAARTAELAGLGAHLRPLDDLVEWDYGDYEGLTSQQIVAQRPHWSLWRDGCPGGESPAAVGERADRALATIGASLTAAGDPVAAVAHGHLLRVLAARWLHQTPAFGAALVLGPASISVLGSEHGAPAIVRWNG